MTSAELTAAATIARSARTPAARLYRAAGSVVIASLNRQKGITGVHTHTHSLRAGFEQLGCGCAVVSPFDGSRLWNVLFAMRRLFIQPLSRSAGIRWYRHWHERAVHANLARSLRQNPADVVLAQCPVTAHAALAVRRELGLDCRIVLVCHFNHSEPEEYRKSGDLPSDRAYGRMLEYETAVLEQVDQVIYVSDWARQTVERERNIHPRASEVIHNGIPETADCPPLTRQALGLSDDDLVLVNVGTLEPRKNQIGLLDLFEQIAQRHGNARLLLVGAGHQRAQIEHAIAQKNLKSKVRLLGARSDVGSILAVSDLYLHYAKLENCPVVLLECARAGLPFAAIAAGGIPELQRAMGVELRLNPDDLAGTLTMLDPVLSDPVTRRALGQKARAAFAERFTTGAMARAYLTALGFSAEPHA
jgi:glycosyltransferase involved in cell wall biosynthesis